MFFARVFFSKGSNFIITSLRYYLPNYQVNSPPLLDRPGLSQIHRVAMHRKDSLHQVYPTNQETSHLVSLLILHRLIKLLVIQVVTKVQRTITNHQIVTNRLVTVTNHNRTVINPLQIVTNHRQMEIKHLPIATNLPRTIINHPQIEATRPSVEVQQLLRKIINRIILPIQVVQPLMRISQVI